MSFPSHDLYWTGVADFLKTHIADNEDILAPREFEYAFVHCFSYSSTHTLPVSGFPWVVVHKGCLDKLDLSFLVDATSNLQPVYTNPVFVVLTSREELPVVAPNNDLIDFNQRLRSLSLADTSPDASPPSTKPTTAPHQPTVEEPQPAAQYPAPAHTDVKVSVITVCRNAAQTIERTIEAVAGQTYPNIEYIVVDGASDDGTLEICDRHSPSITKLVSEPDEGIYQAMNKGIGLATGDWLYFANADDYLFDPYVIQDLVAFVLEHSNMDVIYGDHEARFPDGNTSIYQSLSPEQMLEAIICFQSGCLLQPACLFKRTAFDQVGYFSENYAIASDYQWFLEALQIESLTFAYCPRTIVSYAHGGRSGDIRTLFQEIFDIQNKSTVCQAPPWQQKRWDALQQDFINKYERMEEINRELGSLDRYLQQARELAELRDRHLVQLKQRLSRMAK